MRRVLFVVRRLAFAVCCLLLGVRCCVFGVRDGYLLVMCCFPFVVRVYGVLVHNRFCVDC